MIVCLCAEISDREIRAAAAAGARHCAEIFRCKQRAPRCGSCLETIRMMLGDAEVSDDGRAASLPRSA